MSLTVAAPCANHRDHHPHPLYCELHHIIPQAWQKIFRPENIADKSAFPYAGKSPDHPGVVLFDARTEPLCRTGHGNVHYWIVRIMRDLSEYPARSIVEAEHAVAKRARGDNQKVNPLDITMAGEALVRFCSAGGDLALLWEAGEWGSI